MTATNSFTAKSTQELILMLSNNNMKPEPKSKSERTRQTIIQSSVQCFVNSGVHNTTYEMISKEANVSRPLIMKYFPVKNELFFECSIFVVQHLQSSVNDAIIQSLSQKDICEVYITAHLEWTKKNTKLAMFFLMFCLKASADRKTKKLYNQIMDLGQERIMFFLKNTKKKSKNNDYKEQAKSIQILIAGSMIMISTLKNKEKEYKQVILNTIQLYQKSL